MAYRGCYAHEFDLDDETGISIINKHKEMAKDHLRYHNIDVNQFYDEVQLKQKDEFNNFHYLYTNLDIITKVNEHKISGKHLYIIAEFISIHDIRIIY